MSFLILIFIISYLVFNIESNECPLFIFSDDSNVYSSRLESNNTFKLHNISAFKEIGRSIVMDYSINQNMIIYKNELNDFYMSSIDLKSIDEKRIASLDSNSNSIAIDWIHSLIYFNYAHDIHAMNISNNRMRATIAYNEKFEDIVVNPLESFIFLTKNKTNPEIIRTNQDGSNRTVLVDKDLYKPFSIVIDFETKTIYFMDVNLFSIDFNGNDKKLIKLHQFETKFGLHNPIRLFDIYDANLYTYYGISKVFTKINSDGRIIDKFKINDDYVMSFKIIDSSRQPNGQNKCIDSNCTHLCLPNTYNQFICKCPEKRYLLPGEICESVRYYIKRVAITSTTETSTT